MLSASLQQRLVAPHSCSCSKRRPATAAAAAAAAAPSLRRCRTWRPVRIAAAAWEEDSRPASRAQPSERPLQGLLWMGVCCVEAGAHRLPLSCRADRSACII